jgi:gamma-glutamylcyclotransferase (GGCT)/AIG2-like uncharacterized protein YtfP
VKDFIFVYGLFRDQSKSILGEDATHCGRATVNGSLWKVNDFYPGFKKSIFRSYKVYGDIYFFRSDLLDQMDEYEGDEYRRIRIKTSAGIKCWIYEWKSNVDGLKEITCGDWFLR